MYLFTDHLGSFDRIINESGNIVDVQSFDAWGNRRNYQNWQQHEPLNTKHLFDRGYTGHEHINFSPSGGTEGGIINMNGRLYDPVVARFFSADPFVQAPDYTQNYNRYSYCLNNPIMFTDPSGESFLAFGIGFVVGAYLGGSLVNESFNPGKWNWGASETYFGMGLGGLLGGAVGAVGYGALVEGYAVNLSLGLNINNVVQPMANFLISSSGISLQSLGYVTVAGGGVLLYEKISDIKPPFHYSEGFYHGTEEDAKRTITDLSYLMKLEMGAWLTDKGYYLEPFCGESYSTDYVLRYEEGKGHYGFDYYVKDYNLPLGDQCNRRNGCYRKVKVENINDNLYINPDNIFHKARVYSRIHTHPRSSTESGGDMLNSKLLGIPGIIYGWNGVTYQYNGNKKNK